MASCVDQDAEADQTTTGGPTNRLLRWLEAGMQMFESNYAESQAVESTIVHGDVEETNSPSISEHHSLEDKGPEPVVKGPQPALGKFLVGRDDDILIPNTEQINGTFLKGRNLWRSYLARADSLPPGCMPAASLEVYNLMQDVPPLPQDLCGRRVITGRALWHVPSPELPEHGDWSWNPEHVYGAEKTFCLWIDKPIECRICPRSDFRHCSSGERSSGNSSNGLAILVLCWSYILSVRLLEMQKRSVKYSSSILAPLIAESVTPRPSDIVIHLGHASKELVRWLRAVLAQGSGWLMKGSLPPWTARYEGKIRFVITTAHPLTEIGNHRPPSSSEAAGLLVEFCELYNFESQPAAAFAAALMLPFLSYRCIPPQLPMPRIVRGPNEDSASPHCIQEYVNDLPYFMSLSACPMYLSSAIWSIFWEPGVPCNLASAWVGAIHETIEPILKAGDMERLAKVFALRRPQLAPLWLGLLLCSFNEAVYMVDSFLTLLDEAPFLGSKAGPNPNVAVWTGSRQSFFDEDCSGPYLNHDTQVPRADLLRHRFNFRLGDSFCTVRNGWQPFGTVKKAEIEPELWPRLECEPQSRRYVHWIWRMGRDNSVIELGFRHDKGGHTRSVAEEPRPAGSTPLIPNGFRCEVLLEPSREATVRLLLGWESIMATGDMSIEAVAIPGIRNHPWLYGRQ